MPCRIYEFINITDGQVLNLPIHGFDNQLVIFTINGRLYLGMQRKDAVPYKCTIGYLIF